VAGLRETKKQRTRETIIARALELFTRDGYEATTVADIAAAADIAPRTFFGYFPTKEDVVFHDADEMLASLARRLHERPAGETAIEALQGWIVGKFEAGELTSEAERARDRLIRATPALAARERVVLARIQAMLVEAVARDLGTDERDLRPHLVAAATVAALEVLTAGAELEEDDPLAILDQALVFLAGGLGALRGQDPRSVR
jgi:AcrR family transcriptional regulator